VIALNMENKPGSLARIAKTLGDAGVSVEYLYACIASGANGAFVFLRVEDTEATAALLREHGYEDYIS